MIRRYLPKDVADLVRWYERYISPLSLIAGFLADNYILLRRVDLWQGNLLLFSYLAVAAIGIICVNLIETGRWKHPLVLKIAPLIPVVVQFAFGGLFSGYLSLYSRSAAFPAGWIFVVVLAALLIGNERFTRLYVRPPFQIGLYFTVLFSFLIFFLPVVFDSIGPAMFIFAGSASLLCIALFMAVLARLVPEIVRRDLAKIVRAICVIFAVFNILYFAGAIPPLPLALKDAGVYHSIVRDGAAFRLSGEPVPWYEAYLPYNTVFHRTEGERVYVWSAIFAPPGLELTIFHEWQRYDEEAGEWTTTATTSFHVIGGRDGGFRGYSYNSAVSPGRWRVNVRTEYGQLVGRISFKVLAADSPPPLSEYVK